MKLIHILIFVFPLVLIVNTGLKQDSVTYKSDSWISTEDQKEHKESVEITVTDASVTLKINSEVMVFTIESKTEASHKIEYATQKEGKAYTIKILTFKNATILITGDDLNMAVNAK